MRSQTQAHTTWAVSYVATTLLSAFLLFQVEPLIAKLVLPWFGGGASVWSVCLLFFQSVLVLGYLYAHLSTRRFKPFTQAVIHALLVLLSLLALPLALPGALKPTGFEQPALRILLILVASVGLPYFVLSSSSPLLQLWYSESGAGSSPYRLYAFSNIGSLFALLSYPLLLEPFISSHHQAVGWSVGYVGFVFCSLTLAYRRNGEQATVQEDHGIEDVTWKRKVLWIALATCGSAVLLAVTSYISQNIAAVPLLWTVPLSLYLLTFILCFQDRSWYKRGFFLRFFAVGLAAMAYVLGSIHQPLPPWIVIVIFLGGLFGCCMVCHGELAALKPTALGLTSFYLYVASGGAVGALLVAIVAPIAFSGYYELPIALGFCGLLIHIVMRQEESAVPTWYQTKRGQLLASAMIVALCASLYVSARRQATRFQWSARNFFGVLRIEDVPGPPITLLQDGKVVTIPGGPGYRELINGTIEHGIQFLSEQRRRETTTYYGPQSGVAMAIKAAAMLGPVRVGVIGLGAGTLAAYGQPRDKYTFFEINPLVISYARNHFTFLKDSPAEVAIVQGDARLSIERAGREHFDVLVVDAFSGDSIPTHLLTREAFVLYLQNLKFAGLLAVHVSNRYLNLVPIVLAAAQSLNLDARVIENGRDTGKAVYPATWVILGRPGGLLQRPEFRAPAMLPSKPIHPGDLWTDDYSSVLRAFR